MSTFEEYDIEAYPEEETAVLAVPSEGGEDWDGAAAMKDQANDAKSSGNFDSAVEFLTKAMELGGSLMNRYVYVAFLCSHDLMPLTLLDARPLRNVSGQQG